VAEVKVPEEFLFDVSRSMEDLAFTQREVSRSLDSFNSAANKISEISQSLDGSITSLQNGSLFPTDLLEGIRNLTGTIQEQTRSNEQSSQDMFDILRPQPTTRPINPNSVADILSSIPRFEEGGEMKESGAAVVGESGPELLLIPEGAQVAPLSAEKIGNKLSGSVDQINPVEFLQEFFKSKDVLVSFNEDGKTAVPPSDNISFEPFNIEQRIKETIKEQEGIKKDFRKGIVERREATDKIDVLENLENELNFLQYTSKEDYLKSLNPETPETSIQAQEISAEGTQIGQITNPNLSDQQAAQAQSGTELANTPNAVSEQERLATGSNTGAQTEASLALTQPAQMSEMEIGTQTLARTGTPTPQPPQPPQQTSIEQVTAQDVGTVQRQGQQNVTIPDNLSVTVIKDENTENLLKEMNSSLNRMNSLLSQMTGSLSKTFISSDSYPIRPSNKNF
jgi:hypothetical protein